MDAIKLPSVCVVLPMNRNHFEFQQQSVQFEKKTTKNPTVQVPRGTEIKILKRIKNRI